VTCSKSIRRDFFPRKLMKHWKCAVVGRWRGPSCTYVVFFPASRQRQSRAASVWVRVYIQRASHCYFLRKWQNDPSSGIASNFDLYMSYRWRESFNSVRWPSDSWRDHNGDWHVWAQNAERRGGDGPKSVAALTNQLCSDRGVVRVFEYSINVLYYKYGRNQSWRY